MKQKRVAIYARVSTTMQDTQNQIAQLSKHADSQGWEVVKIYQDDETGTEGRRTRASDISMRRGASCGGSCGRASGGRPDGAIGP